MWTSEILDSTPTDNAIRVSVQYSNGKGLTPSASYFVQNLDDLKEIVRAQLEKYNALDEVVISKGAFDPGAAPEPSQDELDLAEFLKARDAYRSLLNKAQLGLLPPEDTSIAEAKTALANADKPEYAKYY